MLQPEFRDIVFEFAKAVSSYETMLSMIVFGSVARGEADIRSDIDMLVIFDTERPVARLKERSQIGQLALDLEKRFDRSLALVFTNRNFDRLDRQFVESVFREGIIIYGKAPQIDIARLKLLPYSLIYWSLKNLKQVDKMRVRKAIYGHRTVRYYKDKIYRSEVKGLIEQLNGRRTGIASALIPAKKARDFERALKQHAVRYRKLDVWMSQV